SRRERRYVCGERDYVLDGKIFDRGLHLGTRDSRPRTVLEVIELSGEIRRRAAGDPGNHGDAFQILPVAARALHRLAAAARRRERLALLNAALRHVRDKAGV